MPALAGVTVLFVALSCAMTFPIANFTAPVLPDADDAYFSVWRLAWVAHQLPADPLHLFDANIFYPARYTLAYSDAMLAPGVISLPAIRLGLHPVLAHNVLLLLAFVTASVGGWALCRYLFGSTAAAIVGGMIFGFAPYRFGHIGHLELLWTVPMPLALLVLHRSIERNQPTRDGVLLGAIITFQTYCSLYYAAFLSIFVGCWTAVSPLFVPKGQRGRVVRCVAIGGITALVLAAPYGCVYYKTRGEVGPRERDQIERYSAVPADYLRVSQESKTYAMGPTEAQQERSLFPGFVAIGLALLAVVRLRSRIVIGYALLTLIAFELSLGLNGVSYSALMTAIPLLDSLRAPARFSALFLLGLAVLAAAGTESIVARMTVVKRGAVVGGLLAICTAEYWAAPIGTRTPILRPPLVAHWLRNAGSSVILEMPVPPAGRLWLYETSHQFTSIYHWRPLVNGYSGNAPATYIRTLDALIDFPSERGVARLRELGVKHVILHERYYDTAEFADLVSKMLSSGWFDPPLTLPDPVDPAWVFPLRPI
jgi:hypothetical protein